MSKIENKVLQKIKSLMSLADDQEGLPEGDLAAQMAHRLMRENMISHAEVILSERGDGLEIVEKNLGEGTDWRRHLSYALALHVGVNAHYYEDTDIAIYYGYNHDIVLATYLYDIVVAQLELAAKQYKKKRMKKFRKLAKRFGLTLTKDRFVSNVNREVVDFLQSAVCGVAIRLKEIREEAEALHHTEEAEGLILAKKQKVDDFSPDVKANEPARHKTSMEGYYAGKNVSLPGGGLEPTATPTPLPKGLLEVKNV